MTLQPARRDDISRQVVDLHYVVTGDGPRTCILIHGAAVDRNDLESIAAHLSRTHTVLSVDLRGHGLSPAADTYAISDIAADVQALADRLDLRGAVAIGHSLGGLVALELAATTPLRIGGLVILDSSPAPRPDALVWLDDLSDRLLGPNYATEWPEFVRGTALAGPVAFPLPAALAAAIERAARTPPELPRALVPEFVEYARTRSVEALAACSMPILLIGSSAPTVDVDAVRAAAPQTLFAQVAISGHSLQHEVPEQVNAMIDRFIELCLPAEGALVAPDVD
jgi:pimeloyl-ACP methyl ester carboxylesterase